MMETGTNNMFSWTLVSCTQRETVHLAPGRPARKCVSGRKHPTIPIRTRDPTNPDRLACERAAPTRGALACGPAQPSRRAAVPRSHPPRRRSPPPCSPPQRSSPRWHTSFLCRLRHFMSHLLANANIPTGCRPTTIVEGRETDLWVDGRKEGSNRGSRDGVHVVAITRGKEMVETNPSSSNQPNQHVIRSSVLLLKLVLQ